MIRSMTGFGRYEASDEYRKVTVEIKSVNHRYFDLNIHLPKRFSAMETQIRSTLKKEIRRGKVDVYVTYEDYAPGQARIRYNEELAKEYYRILKSMEYMFCTGHPASVTDVARMPEVFSVESAVQDDAEMESLLIEALTGAAAAFNNVREKEGAALKEDLDGKLQQMLASVDRIEERYPQLLEEYRQKLTDKVAELLDGTQMDESRLASEIVLYADKIAVDEETVRLRAHIQSLTDTLCEEGSIGRKLDFIAQEMNRESNTILSKSTDREIADTAIGLKTDVERVREQIQNVE